MTFDSNFQSMIEKAKKFNQMLKAQNLPDDIRLPLLVVLLLKDSKSELAGTITEKPTIEVFFDKFIPESKGEAIAGAAYYLYNYEKRSQFTAKELQEVLVKARIPDIPTNITDLLNKLSARKKWFVKLGFSKGQKLWSLSRPGEQFVIQKLATK